MRKREVTDGSIFDTTWLFFCASWLSLGAFGPIYQLFTTQSRKGKKEKKMARMTEEADYLDEYYTKNPPKNGTGMYCGICCSAINGYAALSGAQRVIFLAQNAILSL
jgi:hypothetical protein